MASATGSLEDSHILDLSKRMTSDEQLLTLGIKGLGLPDFKIKSALYDNKHIQLAAYEVLSSWRKQYESSQDAFQNLIAALLKVEMNQWAAQLQEWAHGAVKRTTLAPERLQKIQELTKQSMKTKPFCLAVNKDWTLPPGKLDLKEIYTKLVWKKKHRKACMVEKEDLEDITKILSEEKLQDEGPVRILVQAPGGMGKSMAMKQLAFTWAEGTAKELQKFQFVFHISLKRVKNNASISEIIVAQHPGLKANRVKPSEIQTILEEDGNEKVLLLIDGHDEYRFGRNDDIDNVITKNILWNCWVILTSRETEQIKELKEYMDAEVDICGFDDSNIVLYITKYFGSKEKADELLKEAAARGLCHFSEKWGYLFHGSFLQVPFLLNMICVLFSCNSTLPETKLEVMKAIVDRCINREAIRACGEKAISRAESTLFKIGKLAWQGLNQPDKKMVFEKEEVLSVAGEEALELGLLMGTENMTPQEEETEVFSFTHLMLQEFLASLYLSKLPKDELDNEINQVWDPRDTNKEVVRFALCLSSDAETFIEVIFNKLIEWSREFYLDNLSEDFLSALGKDMPNHTSMNMMHNKYFNYATQKDPVIHIPCRFYVFKEFQNNIPEFKTIYFDVDKTEEADYSPGELSLSPNGTYSLNNALQIIEEIQKYQRVKIVKLDLNFVCVERFRSYYVLDGVIDPENIALCDQVEEAFRTTITLSENTGLLRLLACKFSESVFEHLAEQLHGCKGMKFLSLNRVEHNFPIKLGASIATFASLEHVEMYSFAKTPEICQAVLRGLSACTQLVSLHIGQSELTNCLKYLFLDSSHCGFPSLEILEIRDAKLNTGDLISLTCAVNNNQLPRLKSLYLWQNTLSWKVRIIVGFQKGKYIVYPTLQTLSFAESVLNQADLGSISQALRQNQLPRLEKLNLESNTLTNCITDLFGKEIPSSYSSLKELNLSGTQLSAVDLRNLSLALSHRVMSNCKALDLSKNKLTGIVSELFTGHGLPFVNTLRLERTQLCPRDREIIIDAITFAKIPKLIKLSLGKNKLFTTEDHLIQLFEACIAYFTEHRINVVVTLNNFSNYLQIGGRISKRCQGTNVSLSWGVGGGTIY